MRVTGAASGNRLEGQGRGRLTVSIAQLALLVVLALACLGGSAGAVIVNLPGRTLSYLPAHGTRALNARSSKSPLTWHGGPVMSSNANYALYWSPSGASAYPAGYQAGIDRYLEDLGHDSGGRQNTDSVLIQYGSGGGEFASYNSSFAGALSDSDPYPPNGCAAATICLTDEQIRSEIAAFVKAQNLPADLHHEYFLLTPPGVESCLQPNEKSCSDGTTHPGYCAYHGDITLGASVVVYANDPYVAGLPCDPGQHPNGNASDATIAGGLAHEHSESLTDPELNAWYDIKGQEAADKCRTNKLKTEYGEALGKAPDGASYNQVINGDLYWFQQEWSNEAGGCAQRLAQLPAIKKIAPKKGSVEGGTPITITGSSFLAPASVSFGGTPASSVVVNSPLSITAIAPPHPPGKVEITVSTPSGTSVSTKKASFTYR